MNHEDGSDKLVVDESAGGNTMMTSELDSETLTRVGPGTPMGDMLRQYWLPAVMSSEIAADGPPIRLMLLGEKLIAFRDSSGRVGIMDHRCPHRCASLFFGRNENDGLRCVYHGWKYDVDGNCLEMPNLPPHQEFKEKVTAKAYKAAERNGVVWAYMGPRAEAPPLPGQEVALLPESEVEISFMQRECNWLQALEGDIDTSHFSFLHFGGVGGDDVPSEDVAQLVVSDRAPGFTVADMDWGMMYGAHRPAPEGQRYWRVGQLVLPFWTLPPHGAMEDHVWARAWVPMDDHHTMFFELSWKGRTPGMRTLRSGELIPGVGPPVEFLPNTTDWFGRWRLAANASNDYRIDRDAQRTNSFTGIPGLYLQDQAVTEGMGPIVDHRREFLAPSDQMIVWARDRLLGIARALADDGTVPPGVDNPEVLLGARGGDFLADENVDWLEAYAERRNAFQDPTGLLRAEAAE